MLSTRRRRPRLSTTPFLSLLLLAAAATTTITTTLASASKEWNVQNLDFRKAKREFLALAQGAYGYEGLVDTIRSMDTPQLKNQTYLDWTGAGVYRASQVDQMANDLKSNLYGNTHSINPSSMLTEERVEEVRERIVQFFNTSLSEYSVIFTSGATAALHLLSETFPWSNHSRFTYLEQSHNSVLGIRELCLHHGGDFCALRESEVNGDHPPASRCNSCGRTDANAPTFMPPSSSTVKEGGGEEDKPFHLFAFPAEDNFSGVKYPLSWIERIQKSGDVCGKRGDWRVLLDAAAFVGTNRLDLSAYKPDFVTISFYKLFGLPTGLGCLLVHKRSVDILRKVYWGGGSVVVAMTSQPITIFKGQPCAKYEDGTLNFLSIQALNPGFDSFAEMGIDRISAHVTALTSWGYEQLMSLSHSNGQPVVRVYGKHDQGDKEVQGGVISFNLLRPDGRYVGYHQVQKMAAKHHFHIRSGCQCNPGACFDYLGLSYAEVSMFFLNKDSCGEGIDVVNGGTLPLGAIRISFGSLTTFEDVQAWIEFVKAFYVDTGKMASEGVDIVPEGQGGEGGGGGGIEVGFGGLRGGGYPVFNERNGAIVS